MPTTRRRRVEVDRSLCVGSAQRLHHAPDTFRLDTARQSHPVVPDPDASEQILEAAENRPVEAVVITPVDGEEPVFPPEEETAT